MLLIGFLKDILKTFPYSAVASFIFDFFCILDELWNIN